MDVFQPLCAVEMYNIIHYRILSVNRWSCHVHMHILYHAPAEFKPNPSYNCIIAVLVIKIQKQKSNGFCIHYT